MTCLCVKNRLFGHIFLKNEENKNFSWCQGETIGRIFAYWAAVYKLYPQKIVY
jgi:hypothetical protein